jgi:hypothetical protein
MVPKQQPHSMASSAPLGNMIATPGAASNMMPTPGNGSSMMPTPGGVSAMMPTPGSTGNLMQSGVGGGGLSNMIPTPGNGNNLMSNGMMLGNGQHLMNGAANLHTPPAYLMVREMTLMLPPVLIIVGLNSTCYSITDIPKYERDLVEYCLFLNANTLNSCGQASPPLTPSKGNPYVPTWLVENMWFTLVLLL